MRIVGYAFVSLNQFSGLSYEFVDNPLHDMDM